MKKYIILFLTICLSLTLSGCGNKYEDTNGDANYTLQTITDKNIINLDVGASGLQYKEENLADILYSSEYSAKNFNGVEQIYQTDFILPSSIEIYVGYINVKKGNFKLVVINNDKIIHEFNQSNTFNETIRFDNLKGSFSIHVAGESSAFEFDIHIL